MAIQQKRLAQGLAVLTVLPILFVILACSGPGTQSPTGNAGVQNAHLLGVILPLSGDTALYGLPMQRAMQLAARVLNTDNDPTNDVQLLFEDSQCDPKKAVSAAHHLLSRNVEAIIGDACSGSTGALIPVLDAAQKVLLSPTASSPSLSGQSEWFFRLTPSDIHQAIPMAKKLSDEFSRVAVIAVNDEYGQGIAHLFKEHFRGETDTFFFTEEEEDFRTLLLKTKRDEALYVIARHQDWKRLLQAYTELGLSTPLFGTETVHEEQTRRLAQETPITYTWLEAPDTEAARMFRQTYREEYNREPEIFTPESFDSVTILAHALSEEGNEHLNDRLRSLTTSGASGPIMFDEDGDVRGKRYAFFSTSREE